MNKKILIPTLGLVVLTVAGAFGVNAASAQNDIYSSFVQRLAERFGLNQEEVQSFVEEQKIEKIELFKQNKEDRLNQAIQDGVITEEQKQALQSRWEDKKAHHEEHKEDMQAWLEEQGIDTEALHEYGGFGHKGFKHWGK